MFRDAAMVTRDGAPIALPLNWSELKLQELPVFRMSDFPEWEKRLSCDPWEGMLKTAPRLKI
jgi:bifunctional non-homologous end joining protein LigD